MKLSDVCAGRQNHLNLIRMLAASGVLVSHAFPITSGQQAIQPLKEATGYTLGWICVAIFFAISGFLITQSFDRKSRVENWVAARIMRLFPGLTVACLLVVLFYGPVFTTLSIPAYFSSMDTWTYVPRNLSLAFLQYGLPGVFVDFPVPGAINGSLWTLVYEVVCYFGVFVMGMLGLLRSRALFAVAIVLYVIAFAVIGHPAISGSMHPKALALRELSFPFAIGMVLYVWREKVRLSFWLGLGVTILAAVARNSFLWEPLFVLALSYWVFYLGYAIGGPLLAYNRLGDYSYGMYIFAFPVQQALVAWHEGMTPGQNIGWAMPVTLLIAIASWHLVEKPGLAQRGRVANLLQTLHLGGRTKPSPKWAD